MDAFCWGLWSRRHISLFCQFLFNDTSSGRHQECYILRSHCRMVAFKVFVALEESRRAGEAMSVSSEGECQDA
jgi:hypothetical protein